MGEKRRTKSKGKTAKSTKQGLRPHEQRAQADGFKSASIGTTPTGSAKPARS